MTCPECESEKITVSRDGRQAWCNNIPECGRIWTEWPPAEPNPKPQDEGGDRGAMP